MAIEIQPLTKILGFTVQGDLGGWTFYTSARRQLVFYPQAPPKEPASRDQTTMRNKFRAAAQAWNAQTRQHKANWQTAAKKAHLRITGYNLYTYWQTTRDTSTIATIERQTKLQLLP